MSNNYFQFKQFIVRQDKCAMKVCTDACLFGAWIAEKMVAEGWQIESMADIGTGTGLLSLMIAQTHVPASIDAIDIDLFAAQQATENFELSPWSTTLNVIQTDIKNLKAENKYDIIISNPPFFENDLKSDNEQRNFALHSAALTLKELIIISKKLLRSGGKFAVLLPIHRSHYFEKLATEYGFYLQEKVLVKHTQKHLFFRSMLLFSNVPFNTIITELLIKSNGKYSEKFTALLQPYYLYL